MSLKLEASVKIEEGIVRVGTYEVTQRAGELDLVINQGQDFVLVLAWWDEASNVARTLTGHTCTLRARGQIGDADAVVDLTGTLQNSDKEVRFALTAAASADLDFVHALYEVVVVDGSARRTRLVQGRLSLEPGVS